MSPATLGCGTSLPSTVRRRHCYVPPKYLPGDHSRRSKLLHLGKRPKGSVSRKPEMTFRFRCAEATQTFEIPFLNEIYNRVNFTDRRFAIGGIPTAITIQSVAGIR